MPSCCKNMYLCYLCHDAEHSKSGSFDCDYLLWVYCYNPIRDDDSGLDCVWGKVLYITSTTNN